MSRRYDPQEFIVPPQVQKGFSERIQCRIQSAHYRALGVVARSGVFPYEEKADVIRWCIKHGLERLNELEPKLIGSVLRQANIAIAIAVDDLQQRKVVELFTTLSQQATQYFQEGHINYAAALVGRVRVEVEKMPDEPEGERIWKLRYLQELERYRYLERAVKEGKTKEQLPPPPPPPTRASFGALEMDVEEIDAEDESDE